MFAYKIAFYKYKIGEYILHHFLAQILYYIHTYISMLFTRICTYLQTPKTLCLPTSVSNGKYYRIKIV